ncbi:MAG: (2Fe-2S)-binding protein [Arcobacteraceae bacterium]
MVTKLTIDGKIHTLDVDSQTVLLWALRDHLNLTGTKFGCGVGQCGACTVLVDGKAMRSCSVSVEGLDGKEITTIANKTDKVLRTVQEAWIDNDVVQCGYCQSGQIMNATGLLKANPTPNEEEILTAMDGNICRCGTYNRIKQAIRQLAKEA